MFPWFWLWSPQVHFPWSGAVTQDISPEAFFGAIPRESGDGRLEHRAFELASYGRQLGWITEVLLAQAGEHDAVSAAKGAESLQRLKTLRARIEVLKDVRDAQLEDAARDALKRLARADRAALARVLDEQREPELPLLPAPKPRARRQSAS